MQIHSTARPYGCWPNHAPAPGFGPPPLTDSFSPGYPAFPPPLPFLPMNAPGWGAPPPWAPTPFPLASQTFSDPLLWQAPLPTWALGSYPSQGWSTPPAPPATPTPYHVAPPIDFQLPPMQPQPPSHHYTPAPAHPKEERPDHSWAIRSLERIKDLASKAKYSASKVGSAFSEANNRSAADRAGEAAWSLREAESDDEKTDSSRSGREAEGKLNSLASLLDHLDDASTDVSSVSSTLSSIRSELRSIDRGSLDSRQIDRLNSSLSQLERDLSAINKAASRVDNSADDARYRARQAISYAGEVAGDRDGRNVSGPAQSARAEAERLQSELQSLAREARSGESDARSLEANLGDLGSDAADLIAQIEDA